MESTQGSADHLVVLVHGLWGKPEHLSYLVAAMRKAYSSDELHIHVPVAQKTMYHTYDGIEVGGERVAHEVETKIQDLEKNGSKITKISFAGYSLGGLISRYAIGLLFANGWFDRIQPINFTTFASPHLGARTPSLGYAASLFNVLGSRTVSASGRQLFLMDSFRDTGRPLISVISDQSSIFMRALAMFKHRSLYANIVNDRSTPYYTSCISRTDPFADMSTLELRPLSGTKGVVLDPEEPFRIRPLQDISLFKRISTSTLSHIQSLPFYALLGVVLPFGGIFFLVNSGIQHFRSAERMRLHESGQAGIEVERYRKTPLIEEMRRVGDDVYRNLARRESQQYLPKPDLSDDDKSSQDTSRGSKEQHQLKLAKEQEGKKGKDGQFKHTEKLATLALTDDQFAMIDSLDHVGFDKYAVHISKVRHTHAAIVVRMQRKSFDQGVIVVQHWVDAFEI